TANHEGHEGTLRKAKPKSHSRGSPRRRARLCHTSNSKSKSKTSCRRSSRAEQACAGGRGLRSLFDEKITAEDSGLLLLEGSFLKRRGENFPPGFHPLLIPLGHTILDHIPRNLSEESDV